MKMLRFCSEFFCRSYMNQGICRKEGFVMCWWSFLHLFVQMTLFYMMYFIQTLNIH